MAPPERFLNFLLTAEKISYMWPKIYVFEDPEKHQIWALYCVYLWNEDEIAKSPRWRHLYHPYRLSDMSIVHAVFVD